MLQWDLQDILPLYFDLYIFSLHQFEADCQFSVSFIQYIMLPTSSTGAYRTITDFLFSVPFLIFPLSLVILLWWLSVWQLELYLGDFSSVEFSPTPMGKFFLCCLVTHGSVSNIMEAYKSKEDIQISQPANYFLAIRFLKNAL